MLTSRTNTDAKTAAEIAGLTHHRLAMAIRRRAVRPENATRPRVPRAFTACDVMRLAAYAALAEMGLHLEEAGKASAVVQLPVRPGTALALLPGSPEVRAEIVPAGSLPLLARKGVVALDLDALATRVLTALEARAAQCLPRLNTTGAPE